MVYCPNGYSDPWFSAPADTHTYGLLPRWLLRHMVYCLSRYLHLWFTALMATQTYDLLPQQIHLWFTAPMATQTYGLLPQQTLTLVVYSPLEAAAVP